MKFRIIAVVLWVLAIGTEVFAIFWLLKPAPFETWHLILLIGLLVVIGALAVGGSMLWKKANRLDPASNKNRVRFFVGTTQDAVAAGKSRLTKQLSQEVRQCGIDPQKLEGWNAQQLTDGGGEEGTEENTEDSK